VTGAPADATNATMLPLTNVSRAMLCKDLFMFPPYSSENTSRADQIRQTRAPARRAGSVVLRALSADKSVAVNELFRSRLVLDPPSTT
jgi:hypothetical protein